MKKKKWLERFKLRGKSVMIPMVILMILTALVPMLLQAMISRRAFNQTQLEAKGIEIQNQCLILSSRLMRSGYMTSDKGNTMELDTRMQTIADIYNGRIVIVNSSFKIMKDTFNLAAGKYYVSEEVIRCFNGETNSRMNQEMGYLTQTIPIHSASDKEGYGSDGGYGFYGKYFRTDRPGSGKHPAVFAVHDPGGGGLFHGSRVFPYTAF